MTPMTLEELIKQLRKIDFCMLNTIGQSGNISSRPMSNNADVEYDGDSWFFSFDDTRKVSDIGRDASVTLTFTAPPGLFGKPGIFIAMAGNASLIRDKTQFERHWTSDLNRWFPEGTETPGIVLIQVSATDIEYWDGEDNGKITLPSSVDPITVKAT